jgi:hypothetical protein
LQLGTVSVAGPRIDANAAKIRSLRGACPRAGRRPDPWDRAQARRAKLAADIAALTAAAEAADAADGDPQALPAEIARRDALNQKRGAACARPAAEEGTGRGRKGPYKAKKERRGRPPKPPDGTPPPNRQTNLTDPGSQLMRKSEAPEYRRAYNAPRRWSVPRAAR